jgi:hypothetical protein
MPNPWGWPQIRQLLDEVLLTDDWKTTDSPESEETMSLRLYGFLPKGKGELRRLRDNAKRYYRLGSIGGAARETVKPYRSKLRALVWATRWKLASVLTAPNLHDWGKPAWGVFQSLQANLGSLRRVYVLTLTFREHLTYAQIRDRLRGVTRNILYRAGFQSADVIALHPKPDHDARLHAHLIVWSRRPRSRQADAAAAKRVDAALSAGRYGAGLHRLSPASNLLDALAYFAWNYDSTLKLAKGEHNPIPKHAKILSLPQEVQDGRRWARTGKFSFVNPQMRAWRAAVGKYAVATGKTAEGDWRWIWRERHRIRAYLEPEQWAGTSVTGLDGFTYQIRPYGEDYLGNETYLVTNEQRGGFVVTDHGLAVTANYQAAYGTLPQNDRLDLTTGKRANWREVWGAACRRLQKPAPRRRDSSGR